MRMMALPPSEANLHFHVRRAHLQAMLRKATDHQSPTKLDMGHEGRYSITQLVHWPSWFCLFLVLPFQTELALWPTFCCIHTVIWGVLSYWACFSWTAARLSSGLHASLYGVPDATNPNWLSSVQYMVNIEILQVWDNEGQILQVEHLPFL